MKRATWPPTRLRRGRVDEMLALELMCSHAVAVDDRDLLAAVATAWCLLGWTPCALDVYGARQGDVWRRVLEAVKGKDRRRLRDRALGLIDCLDVMAFEGVADGQDYSDARLRRWQAEQAAA